MSEARKSRITRMSEEMFGAVEHARGNVPWEVWNRAIIQAALNGFAAPSPEPPGYAPFRPIIISTERNDAVAGEWMAGERIAYFWQGEYVPFPGDCVKVYGLAYVVESANASDGAIERRKLVLRQLRPGEELSYGFVDPEVAR